MKSEHMQGCCKRHNTRGKINRVRATSPATKIEVLLKKLGHTAVGQLREQLKQGNREMKGPLTVTH